MKAKEVLELLKISRPTLAKYVREGRIRVTVMPNGLYDYNDEDVYKILYRGINKKTCIYARVSDKSQIEDLENEIAKLKEYCTNKGYEVQGVYVDVSNDLDFENRNGFFRLLDDVIAGKIGKVIVASKDKLIDNGFELLDYIFKKYHCKVIIASKDS